VRIDERAKTHGLREELVHESDSLWAKLSCHIGDAGNDAAGPIEARDQTELDRVTAGAEDNRNGRGRGLSRAWRNNAAGRGENGNPTTHQISGQFRQSVELALRPAIFDREVLAFDIAQFAQPLAKRQRVACVRFG
jgi:hypothetical protein